VGLASTTILSGASSGWLSMSLALMPNIARPFADSRGERSEFTAHVLHVRAMVAHEHMRNALPGDLRSECRLPAASARSKSGAIVPNGSICDGVRTMRTRITPALLWFVLRGASTAYDGPPRGHDVGNPHPRASEQ